MKLKFRFTKLLYVLALALMLALLIAPLAVSAKAPAQSAAPEIVNQVQVPVPSDLPAFLQWLIGGGGSILAVSWLLERMKWFQVLTSDQKDYTIFGAAVVVGCGALAVINWVPGEVIEAITPFFLIVASTFAAVFIAKVFHRADKSS